jgi:translation elongation factor EF-G
MHLRAGRPDSVDLAGTDLLVMVTSAGQGVPSEAGPLWQSAAERGLPALIVVTHLDDSNADLEEITAMCTRVLSDGGIIFLPWLAILDDDEAVCGFINLLSEEIIEWSEGGPVVHESEPRHQELIEDPRAELCESVILAVDDDTLFAAYMSGALIDGEVIESHMLEQTSRGLRHPVIGTALRPHLLGVGLVLDTIAGIHRQKVG